MTFSIIFQGVVFTCKTATCKSCSAFPLRLVSLANEWRVWCRNKEREDNSSIIDGHKLEKDRKRCEIMCHALK